jgi:hypothetical protein
MATTSAFLMANRPWRAQNHESAHAVAAAFLELEIKDAWIDGDEGAVNIIRGPDPWKCLVFILAGPCGSFEPLAWPPQDLESRGRTRLDDEAVAAGLVAELRLDRDGWDDAQELAHSILTLPRVRRARRVISRELEQHGAMTGDDIRRAWEDAKQAEAAPRSTT